MDRPRYNRLKKFWESQGFRSATEFAAFLEIGKSHISDIDKKDNPAKLLQSLSLKMKLLNLHWLLTGDGPMLHEGVEMLRALDNLPFRELIKEFGVLTEANQWLLVSQVKKWLADLTEK